MRGTSLNGLSSAGEEDKGVEGIFDIELGKAGRGIGLVIGGAILSFVADYIPGAFGRVGRIVGVGLMGFGGLDILAGLGIGKTEGEDAGTALPPATAKDLASIRASIIKPARGGKAEKSTVLTAPFGRTYAIEYSLSNKGTKRLTVHTELRVQEFPRALFADKHTSTFTRTVTILPGETKIVKGDMPILASMASGIDAVAELIGTVGTLTPRTLANSEWVIE